MQTTPTTCGSTSRYPIMQILNLSTGRAVKRAVRKLPSRPRLAIAGLHGSVAITVAQNVARITGCDVVCKYSQRETHHVKPDGSWLRATQDAAKADNIGRVSPPETQQIGIYLPGGFFNRGTHAALLAKL